MTRALAVAAVLVGLLAGPASAAQRFADPNGSGTDCTSASPCPVAEAINNAGANDEVILAPGDYGPVANQISSSAANLNVHGTDGQPRPRIFASTPDDTAGLEILGAGATVRHLEVHQQAAALRQIGFTFGGAEASDIVATNRTMWAACVLLGGPVLKNSVCEGTNSGGARGIYTYRSGTNPGPSTATIRNVTASALGATNSGTAIDVIGGNGAGEDSNVTVTNTIAVGGLAGIGANGNTGDATVTVDHSAFLFQSETAGGDVITDEPTIIRQNPPFVATGSFHEPLGAVTIGRGADDPLNGAFDIDGNPRILGLDGTDIGADEFVPAPTASTGDHGPADTRQVTVNGLVNPNTVASNFHFEYGTTTGYGSSTPDASAGSGPNDTPVSALLAGLNPGTTYHYRVVAQSAGGTATGADRTVTTAGTALGSGPGFLGAMTLGNGTFRAANSGASAQPAQRRRRRRTPIGTLVSFRLDRDATVRFTVERVLPGKRSGRRCVKRNRRNRRARNCKRYPVMRGSFNVDGKSGRTRFKFSGRLRSRKLPAARYRLVAVAIDAAGNRSAAKRANFRIVRR